MDRLQVKFYDLVDTGSYYYLRIPETLESSFKIEHHICGEDLLWRTNCITYDYYQGVKLSIDGYRYEGPISYKEELESYIIDKKFLKVLQESMGCDKITLEIMAQCGLVLKRKVDYLTSYLFNCMQRYKLQEVAIENALSEGECYNVLSPFDNEVLGCVYINDGNMALEIYSGKYISIMSLYNSIDRHFKKNRRRVLSRNVRC